MKQKNLEKDEILLQIRDLLVLQLRASNVPPISIGRILDLNAKTIRNRFPIGRESEKE